VALYVLCPHRYFPLAKGRLEGDNIVCGYHGFQFAPDGKCVAIPSQGTGAGFYQPSYRIEERGPLCWIWMGDPDKCSTDKLPPFEDFGLGQDGWHASSFNHFEVQGRYQLIIDNLMDLTHLPYIHELAGGDVMKNPPIKNYERERSFQTVRTCRAPWGPFMEFVLGPEKRFEGICGFNSVTDFYGPELIRTSGPIVVEIDGMVLEENLGEPWIIHAITPQTQHSTHYFGLLSRNFRLGDRTLDEGWLASDNKVRGEDKTAIEAVEARLEMAVAHQMELLVRSDEPAVRARGIIQEMLDAES
jgi:vanillate O-demethylase monooxygenase subunit